MYKLSQVLFFLAAGKNVLLFNIFSQHTLTQKENDSCVQAASLLPLRNTETTAHPVITHNTAKAIKIDFVFTGQGLTGRGDSRVGNSTL